MSMFATLRPLLLAALIAAPAALLPQVARAQHVVTEDEAAKLNFDALTAAPTYHAPIARRISYRAAGYAGHAAAASGRTAMRDAGLVHYVSAHHTVNTHRTHGQRRRG